MAPLAAAGLLLAWPVRRRCLALYLLVLSGLAVLITTFVLSRCRIAFAAALVPFAALTLVRLAEWVAARRLGRAAATAVAVGALSLVTAKERPAGSTRVRVSDVVATFSDYYLPRIRQADARGDWAQSAAVFRDSLGHEPPEVRGLGASRPARGAGEIALGQMLSRVHAGYADRLRAAGQSEAADREEQRSRELSLASGAGAAGRAGEPATMAPRPHE